MRSGFDSRQVHGNLGSGSLGIYVALRNHHVQRLTLRDWLLTPLLYGLTNWYLNGRSVSRVECRADVGLFTHGIVPKFDRHHLVVCNPPYLPLANEYKTLGLDQTVAGTDLLEHTIRKASGLGNSVYIQCSDLAKPEITTASQESRTELEQIGSARKLPFRLKLLEGVPEYLERLITTRGLQHSPKERHPYWHMVRTYRASAKQKHTAPQQSL